MPRRRARAAWVHRSGAVERIREELRAASPVVEWLRAHVGPSLKPRARR